MEARMSAINCCVRSDRGWLMDFDPDFRATVASEARITRNTIS
jgi:hypothetical protein